MENLFSCIFTVHVALYKTRKNMSVNTGFYVFDCKLHVRKISPGSGNIIFIIRA